jgi:hypothetical protein
MIRCLELILASHGADTARFVPPGFFIGALPGYHAVLFPAFSADMEKRA